MYDQNPVHAIKLDECGLVRLFGELEARIMEAVWALEAPTVRDLCVYLGSNCNYKTIMTVANRLVEKGALERQRCGRAYVYTPVALREPFIEAVARETLTGLIHDFGDAAMAGFVQAVDQAAPQQLRALQALIEERLSEA